jgi:hypothetical protein
MPKYRLTATEVFNAGFGGSPTTYTQVTKVFPANDDQDAQAKVPEVLALWNEELMGYISVDAADQYFWSHGVAYGFNHDRKPLTLVRIDREAIAELATQIPLPTILR